MKRFRFTRGDAAARLAALVGAAILVGFLGSAQAGCDSHVEIRSTHALAASSGSGSSSTGDTSGVGGSFSCLPDEKPCGAKCEKTDDPSVGCAAPTCSPCALENATAACTGGACMIAACHAGHWNCDGIAGNGCEASVPCPPPPSCQNTASGAGAHDCGPEGASDCCESPLVPGGTFSRSYDGVTNTGFKDFTDPKYVATVSSFRLDTYEITVGRFRAFVEAGMGTSANPPIPGAGAHPALGPSSGWDPAWNMWLRPSTSSLKTHLECFWDSYPSWTASPAGNERLPQNCITWLEAFAFCVWDGGRLPTEAEWNFAAAGGAEQRVYPWSTPPTSTAITCANANYDDEACCGDGGPYCTPLGPIFVGTKPAGNGKWGHADLAGNVEEWNLDFYADPYGIIPCIDCANLEPPIDNFRVLRGGTYRDYSTWLRASYRGQATYPAAYDVRGARCTRSP